ncbi:hypothetical protein BDQ12DRAFT_651090 [Crucibulum laeve]|uniref:F-box domain-containing protein n=1 Tax=Crucibulum laeve TaxID=68775 RepID=A0A5C3LZZ0_9AGAR|nr:hypothetical protein BDQ12DRAFT_651090 [Crucibulum laeve]
MPAGKHKATDDLADDPEPPDEEFRETSKPDEEHEDKGRARKKRKPYPSSTETKHGGELVTKKVRGKRGILKQVTEVPLDILFEIFSQLDPIDLLHLARTTKSLRAVMMHPSSASIWRKALANVIDLPGCPDDMQEPKYASLIFETFCHYCLASNVHNIVWETGKRVCSECCFDSNLYTYNFDIEQLPRSITRELVPCVDIKTTEIRPTGRRHKLTRTFYCVKTAKQWNSEYKALVDGDKAKLVEWKRVKRTKRELILAHANLCEEWFSCRSLAQTEKLEQVKEDRIKHITAKLTELGWGEEIQRMDIYEFESHPNIGVKKGLTDRIWENIKPKVVQFMEDVKARRLVREKKNTMKCRQALMEEVRQAYALTCPPNSIIPPATDIYCFKPFLSIIEDTPFNEDVTIESFHDVMHLLPTLIEDWRRRKDRQLLDMIATATTLSDVDEKYLHLATTTFSCIACHYRKCSLTYPRILVHKCASSTYFCLVKWEKSELAELFSNLRRTTWNYGRQINFNTAMYQETRKVVKLCGLDPDTTTVEGMDTLNPIFECVYCYNNIKGRCCLTWRAAPCHILSRHEANTAALKLLDAGLQSAALAQLTQLTFEQQGTYLSDNLFCCVYCQKRGHLIDLKNHIVEIHPKLKTDPRSDIVPVLDEDPALSNNQFYSFFDPWAHY